MKLNKLASAILRGTFLLDLRAADTLYSNATRFLNGEKVSWFDDDEDPAKKAYLDTYVYTKESRRQNLSAQSDYVSAQDFYGDAPAGSIAIIPIDGTIMKDDFCGSTGTDTVSTWLMAALQSPNIIGAVLKINSPGGSVEGTAECADVIAFVASLMPVEVYCDGMLCSAAMWLASQASRITASSGTVEIGCIGTAANYKDYSKGSAVISHYITADASFDKNKEAIEVFKGNYALLKTSILNPTNDIFLTAVKSGRDEALQLTDVQDKDGNVIGQYPLTGQVYIAQAAIDLGLIDAIGNLQTVLDSIRASASAYDTNQPNNNMSIFGNKFKNLGAIKTKKAADITESELEAVNNEFKAEGHENVVVITTAHFEEASTNADTISSGLEAINKNLGAKHANLNEAITALIADRDDANAKAEEFGGQPGEMPSKPQSNKGSEGALPEDKNKKGLSKYETSYDRELAARNAKVKEAGLE